MEKKELKEVNGYGYILSHNKTKARVAVIENDDTNKVFTIGFRTPPADDTGVPHITEHSVLCGSRKFPVKDPFVELCKGSLNTFLNAMTYSDKTVYPLASLNEKDFHNLMHVYMDAVFYPNMYEKKEIMMQEGWHYEIDEETGELTYNGVVFNEMKGVYSSSEQQLYRIIEKSLLPHTAYGFESGGDPEAIPNLTQEDFIAFHKRYYHPSNSYIYLYGDMDAEAELRFIDEEYLQNFDYLEIDSALTDEPAFEKPVEVREYYSIAENESEQDNTYLTYNTVVGTSADKKLCTAFSILEYALLSAPGAPLKKALIDAGLGKDLNGLVVDTGDPKSVGLGSAVEGVGALVRVVDNVGLQNGHLSLAVGDHVDVRDGSAGGLNIEGGKGQLGVEDGLENAADSVVGTGGTTGRQSDRNGGAGIAVVVLAVVRLLTAAGDQREDHREREDQS